MGLEQAQCGWWCPPDLSELQRPHLPRDACGAGRETPHLRYGDRSSVCICGVCVGRGWGDVCERVCENE